MCCSRYELLMQLLVPEKWCQHNSTTCLPWEAPVHQAQLVNQRPTPQAACGSLHWVHGLLEAAYTPVFERPERAQVLLWLHWLQVALAAHRTSLRMAKVRGRRATAGAC